MQISIRRKIKNWMHIEFSAVSENEQLARIAVASFITPLNPTLEEMADVKTAVSEAVTNAIIHGYGNLQGYGKYGDLWPGGQKPNPGKVWMRLSLEEDVLTIEVEDKGEGIADVEKAMEPLYTSKPEYNRSGMGFAFMEAFMDDLEVISEVSKGTLIRMKKKMNCGAWAPEM